MKAIYVRTLATPKLLRSVTSGLTIVLGSQSPLVQPDHTSSSTVLIDYPPVPQDTSKTPTQMAAHLQSRVALHCALHGFASPMTVAHWHRYASRDTIASHFPRYNISLAHEALVAVAAVSDISATQRPLEREKGTQRTELGADIVDLRRVQLLVARRPQFVDRWLPQLRLGPGLSSPPSISTIGLHWGLRECLVKIFKQNKAVLMHDLKECTSQSSDVAGVNAHTARFRGETATRLEMVGLGPTVQCMSSEVCGHLVVIAAATGEII